jgi:hypothetical protein
MWTRQDNGADLDFKAAVAYCDGLSLAGHEDWRLPTIEELAALYREEVSNPRTYNFRGKDYPLRIDPRFELSAAGVWSSTDRYKGMVAWSFFFSSGKRLASRYAESNYQRALCVRGGA